MTIESLPPSERSKMDARLHEAKVVLIRSLISDQLRYKYRQTAKSGSPSPT